jgi:hypothetical protein
MAGDNFEPRRGEEREEGLVTRRKSFRDIQKTSRPSLLRGEKSNCTQKDTIGFWELGYNRRRSSPGEGVFL